MRIYIDDNPPAAQQPAGGTIATPGTPLYLGRSQGGGDAFNGMLDDVRIYGVALTGPQVGRLYNDVMGTLPTCDVTAPAPGATFADGANITISADAADVDGIAQVDFLYNGVLIGPLVPGSIQGRLDQPLLTNAEPAAVLADQVGMNDADDRA